MRELAVAGGSLALGALSNLFFNGRSDLFNELDCSFDGVINEALYIEQMFENGLCCVAAKQMAREKLSNELDVAEKLVLPFKHEFLMVLERVLLAAIFSLFLQGLEIVLQEDFLEAAPAVLEELLAEGAELEIVGDSSLPLRLQVNLDDRGAQLTVELRVGVLYLRFAENRLDHDLKNLFVDLESLHARHVETIFGQQLARADQHLSELGNFPVQVVRSDLVQLQSNLLNVVLLLLGFLHV